MTGHKAANVEDVLNYIKKHVLCIVISQVEGNKYVLYLITFRDLKQRNIII